MDISSTIAVMVKESSVASHKRGQKAVELTVQGLTLHIKANRTKDSTTFRDGTHRGDTHTERCTEGTPDLEAFRLEGDSVKHSGIDHHIVGVVQHICIEGPTGIGLMYHSP